MTARQIRFAKLCVEFPDTPTTAHYRQLYPARNGTRARQTEWNAAHRLSRNPKVAAYVEELRAIEPQQAKTDALIRLSRISKGELPPEQAIFAQRQLREANRELRAAEKNSQRGVWALFWSAQRALMRSHRLSPDERTKLIFARFQPAPDGQPMVSAEALAAELVAAEDPPRSAEEEAARKELVEFVQARQRELAPFVPEPPAEPPAPWVPPEPAGHWRYEPIPGRFGKAARRRVWVADTQEERDA
jgi:hypothetical protein